MTDDTSFFTNKKDAHIGAGSTAPIPGAPATLDKKAPKSPSPQEEYYNVKVPTLGTAAKKLWNFSKKIAQKADPVANKVLDSMIGGIAKVAGLPDPKTGKGIKPAAKTTKTKETAQKDIPEQTA